MTNTLETLKNSISLSAYGITKQEAHSEEICINCKQKIYIGERENAQHGCCYSMTGIKEYKISGMCEYCFDNLMTAD